MFARSAIFKPMSPQCRRTMSHKLWEFQTKDSQIWFYPCAVSRVHHLAYGVRQWSHVGQWPLGCSDCLPRGSCSNGAANPGPVCVWVSGAFRKHVAQKQNYHFWVNDIVDLGGCASMDGSKQGSVSHVSLGFLNCIHFAKFIFMWGEDI